MDLKAVLSDLSVANGVSGDEQNAAATARRYLDPLVDSTELTPLGCLVGYRWCGKTGKKTLLLDAHLDQVGLIVTGERDGLLTFAGGVGGVDDRMLPGLQVVVLTQPPILGVVGWNEQTDEAQPASRKDLYIDCGISHEKAMSIPVGTRIAYTTEPWSAGNRFFGKSLDNRSCFLALLRALELVQDQSLNVNLVVLGSTQEETTGVGALTGAFSVHPDMALVTDVTFGDSPDSPKDHGFPLGSGAAIGYSPVLDRKITRRLKALAEQEKISYVQEVMSGSTGTNSMHTQIAGTGVPTGLISLPLRYMHTPVEEVDLRDLEAVARLTAAFIRSCGEVDQ